MCVRINLCHRAIPYQARGFLAAPCLWDCSIRLEGSQDPYVNRVCADSGWRVVAFFMAPTLGCASPLPSTVRQTCSLSETDERVLGCLARSSSGGPPFGDVVVELILSCILAPLGSFDLRRAVCGGLTALGIKTARECGRVRWHLPEEDVILFSAFDGIGGFFLAWDRLGSQVAVWCASEVNPASIRVSRCIGPLPGTWETSLR